jgi:hypothetical protein
MPPTKAQVEHIERWFRDSFPGRSVESRENFDLDLVLFRASQPHKDPLELEVSYEAFEDIDVLTIVSDLTLHGVAESLLREPLVRLRYTKGRQVARITNRQPHNDP